MVFSVNNYWYILKGYDESFALICQCISTLPNLCVDEEEKSSQSKTKPHANELSDGKAKPVRHGYVRKPFLYSKYFSDSDDERTVEQRRQSIVSAPLALLVCWPQNFSEQKFHFWFGDGSVFSFFSLLGLFFFCTTAALSSGFHWYGMICSPAQQSALLVVLWRLLWKPSQSFLSPSPPLKIQWQFGLKKWPVSTCILPSVGFLVDQACVEYHRLLHYPSSLQM